MSRPADEHVFQAGLVDGDADDLTGKRLHHLGHEAMAAFDFQPHATIEHSGMQAKALLDVHRQSVGLIRFQQDRNR